MKILTMGVRYSQKWQTRPFESIDVECGFTAALEGTSPEVAAPQLLALARQQCYQTALPTLKTVGRELTTPSPEVGLDSHEPEPEEEQSSEACVTHCSVTYARKWQLQQYESLGEELFLFAELEPGDNPQEVSSQLLRQAKQLVQDDARPILMESGRIAPSRTRKQGGQEVRQTGDNQPQSVPAVAGGTGVWL